MLVFDVETSAIDDTDAIFRMVDPFVPPDRPGQFDPAAVKCGNLKDAAKIAEKVAAAEKQHAALVENYAAECDRLQAEWRAKVLADAALSAVTGRVVVFGVMDINTEKWNATAGAVEEETLELFWKKYQDCRNKRRPMVGHNIEGFDLPFLIRRSIILRVDIPRTVYTVKGKWTNYDELFIDTRHRWLLGQNAGQCESSLDHLGIVLDEGGKLEVDGRKLSGADFGRTWNTDRDLAMRYLHRDLKLTRDIAVRLGVC